jgi:hypothetical protein
LGVEPDCENGFVFGRLDTGRQDYQPVPPLNFASVANAELR